MSRQPRVFVVNEPIGHDGTRLKDLSPALAFGQLTHVLSAGNLPDDPKLMVDNVRAGLKDFTEEDYLLLVGDPIAIGCAASIATEMTGGPVQFLRWVRRIARYQVVAVDLGWDEEPSEEAVVTRTTAQR